MKKLILSLFALTISALAFSNLVITGVIDGPLPGGQPKAIEVYVVSDINDMSLYGIGAANNGGGTDGVEFTFDSGFKAAGTYIYLANDSADFITYFGFQADYTIVGFSSPASINGDDAIELFRDSIPFDIYGDINVDGTSQPWEYKDSWCYRNDNTGPDDSMFVIGNWTIAPPDTLDGDTTNATSTYPFPIGTYTNINAPNGALVDDGNGNTVVNITVGDLLPDVFNFNTTSTTGSYTYLITDQNDSILAITSSSFDFEGSDTGTCYVYGLSYDGNLLAMAGMYTQDILSSKCYSLSSNFVTVNKTSPPPTGAGNVSLMGGGNVDTICHSGQTDRNFTNNTNSTSYAYVVTDVNKVIQFVSDTTNVDFINFLNNNPCRVYGVDYNGTLNNPIGQSIDTATMSSSTFAVTTNWVAIYKFATDGGTVSLSGGATTDSICIDGTADVLNFSGMSTSPLSYSYIITDDNNNVLAYNASGSNDFDAAGPGTCRIYGMSYNGSITPQLGSDATTASHADDCFELSTNYITVVRTATEATMVEIMGGGTTTSICVGDGNADTVMFDNDQAGTNSYQYIITDNTGNILSLPSSNFNDFEGAGTGVCRVYGVDYTGTINQSVVNMNISTGMLSDECYLASSNYIEVTRVDNGAPCPTAIEEVAAWNLVIGPNPTEGIVSIMANPSFSINYTLFDIKGTELRSGLINGSTILDITEFNKGVYYLHLSDEKSVYSKPIIKNN